MKKTPIYLCIFHCGQELYDSIPALYDDAQKYRDIIETIRWDESGSLSPLSRTEFDSVFRNCENKASG